MYCGRQNITVEGITKKNPGARVLDREDKMISLCSVRVRNK
jgi:hypothetical protein